MKINLGCGPAKIEGYINVDKNPAVGPDVCAHAADYLVGLNSAFVDEIRMSHFLEHVIYDEAVEILGETARALRPGGKVCIWIPDFQACCKALGENPKHPEAKTGIYGHLPYIRLRGEGEVHKWGWTREELADALTRAGLVAGEPKAIPQGGIDRDFYIEGVKP